MAKFVLAAVMVLLILVAINVPANAKYDCFRSCSAKCYGKYRAACVLGCQIKCRKSLPISDASDSCFHGCLKSMATNFHSDVEKAERCVDSCADKGKKKN